MCRPEISAGITKRWPTRQTVLSTDIKGIRRVSFLKIGGFVAAASFAILPARALWKRLPRRLDEIAIMIPMHGGLQTRLLGERLGIDQGTRMVAF